jgi:HrpA-like RNA helicase
MCILIAFISIFTGDILVFMPGQEDIEVTCELLAGKISFFFSPHSEKYLTLHGLLK